MGVVRRVGWKISAMVRNRFLQYVRKWLHRAHGVFSAAIRRIRVFCGVLYIYIHRLGFRSAETASEVSVGGVRDASRQLIKQPPTGFFPPDDTVSDNDLSNQIDTVLKYNFDDVNIHQQEVREAFMPKMLEGRAWNDSFEEAMINYTKSKCNAKINDDPSMGSSENV